MGSTGLGSKALPAYIPKKPPPLPIEIDPRGTAENFSWSRGNYMGKAITRYQVEAGGNSCLLLYDPGAFTPFEIQGVYSLEGVSIKDSDSSNIKIVRKGTSSTYSVKNDLDLVLDGNNTYVRVVLESDQVRSMLSRYPLRRRSFPPCTGRTCSRTGGEPTSNSSPGPTRRFRAFP